MHLRFSARLSLFTVICLAPATWALKADNDNPTNVVYVQTNNPAAGQNAVLGYFRNPATGELQEMPGSPFLTGGTGRGNPNETIGLDDADQEIVATRDRHFLYTVNSGSNTIAGFAIQKDGTLRTVPGSPFASGGVGPESIGIDGNILIVVNRGDQNPGGGGGSHDPNYAGFLMLPDGSLVSLPWSELSLTPGSAPFQALISPTGRLMFDTHLFETPLPQPTPFGPPLPPFSSVIHSYRVTGIGQVIPASSIDPPADLPPFVVGLQVHPTQKILYAGLTVASALATYTYDNEGNLSYIGATPGGGLGICWITLAPGAKTLYAATAVSDQVDVYSLEDPLHPQLMQTVSLNGPKEPLVPASPLALYTTTDFQLTTTPDGQFLYVVNHADALAQDFPQGNALHILKINPDGTLAEISSSPMIFPQSEVPANTHPLGVVAF